LVSELALLTFLMQASESEWLEISEDEDDEDDDDDDNENDSEDDANQTDEDDEEVCKIILGLVTHFWDLYLAKFMINGCTR
jgi:ABC-type Zn2+ transport system substrate-binding protein/surface adhesin